MSKRSAPKSGIYPRAISAWERRRLREENVENVPWDPEPHCHLCAKDKEHGSESSDDGSSDPAPAGAALHYVKKRRQ